MTHKTNCLLLEKICCNCVALWIISIIPYISWSQFLIPFESKTKKGLKDSNGNIVVPAQYDVCEASWNGEYWIVASGGKFDKSLQYMNGTWAVLDRSGKPLIEPQANEISEYIYTGGFNSNLRKDKETLQGYFTIKNAEGKYGLINYSGKQIIPCISENIGQFDFSSKENYLRMGMIPYKVNGLWGVIDVNGNEILKTEHSQLYNFVELPMKLTCCEFAVIVGKGSRYGILSANKHVVPAEYDSIWLVDINEKKLKRLWSNIHLENYDRYFDILRAFKGGKEFLINDQNVIIDGIGHKDILAKVGDTLIATKGGKYHLVKITDGAVVPHPCNNITAPANDAYIHYCKHRLFPYQLNGLWGVMDMQGKDILKPEYSKLDYLSSHPDSRAVTVKGTKMGVLYASGHIVPAIYDSIQAYDINTGEKMEITNFDKKHLVVGKPAIPLSERYLAVVLNGKSLVINSFGEEIPEAYLKKRIAEYVPPHLREPTELEKQVNKMLYKNVGPKPEYIVCEYCKGKGKTSEKTVTYKTCPTCKGFKKYLFLNQVVYCYDCNKYGKVVDKETYHSCPFCRGNGMIKND